tara:strand:- start:35 stop:1162 length:1128 start_codon:yes stop_codon:yes gene_type:complete
MAFSKAIAAALKKKKKKKKVEKVEVDAAEKKPITKRQFKKDYEVDIGKPNPTDRTIRDMPQRKVRGTSGKAADTGSDPIVVGKKSMPSFADVNAASGAAKSRLKAKLRKLAEGGSDIAKARLKRIEKFEAKSEADRVTKSAIGRAGTKKVPDGTYVDRTTGEVFDIDSSDIKVKKLPKPLSAYMRNPTQNQLEQISRNMFAHRKLKATGEDKKETIKRLELQLAAKYNRVKGKDAASIDITKGLTAAEKKKLGLKQGGMAMKKKGYAKGGMKKKGMAKGGMKKKGYAMGGMKKKGMAMGGLKKPAANQTGLKKLPTTVRNKMGYAQKGGMMKKKGMARGGMKKKSYAMGGMTVKYKVGGMAKGKSYGMVDNRKKK